MFDYFRVFGASAGRSQFCSLADSHHYYYVGIPRGTR